jgi:hypothetical protein
MSVDLKALNSALQQVRQHLDEYEYHIDFNSRLLLVKKGKRLLVEYFKHSIALNKALYAGDKQNKNLQTTLRIYAKDMHEEGKRIISAFLKYGRGCENKHRVKFQMEIAEAINLLEHRIRKEKEHLIPEYLNIVKHEPEHLI